MATKNFTQFSLETVPLTGDYLVGYKADGSTEFRTTVEGILEKSGYQAVNNSSIQPTSGNNVTTGYYSNIGGGVSNTASGYYSNVAGGQNNTASESYSNVAGGSFNTASGYFSNVAGGYGNNASGGYSSILGGINNNTNNQACSFIIGQGIIASQPNFTYVNTLSALGLIVANKMYMYDPSGVRWMVTVTTTGALSTINA